jgi:hypothetical protein
VEGSQLPVVNFAYFLKQPEINTTLLSNMPEGGNTFREAGTAISEASPKDASIPLESHAVE